MGRGRGRFPVRPQFRPAPPRRRDRRLREEEQATCDALRAEYDALEAEYAGADELPEEVDARLGEIEAALEAFESRPAIYDPADIARAGAFVSINPDGGLRVERGYVRPEDEAPAEPAGDVHGPGERTRASDPARVGSNRHRPPASAIPRPNRPRKKTASSRCRIGSSPS